MTIAWFLSSSLVLATGLRLLYRNHQIDFWRQARILFALQELEIKRHDYTQTPDYYQAPPPANYGTLQRVSGIEQDACHRTLKQLIRRDLVQPPWNETAEYRLQPAARLLLQTPRYRSQRQWRHR